jgi:hypothetical protein
MRSYRLLAVLLSALSSCSFGTERDYQVVVTWLLNGFIPDAALCQELGIATARLEVRSGAGDRVKTLEAPCDRTVPTSQGEYGGFITSQSFAWEVNYTYSLTLLDAAGNARSDPPATGEFYVAFDDGNVVELGYLDYVAPLGNASALYGEWTVKNEPAATACAAIDIAQVRIVAVSAQNTEFEAPVLVATAPCAEGRFSSNGAKILARGDYLFRYEAYSAAGALVETGSPIAVLVDGTDVTLPRELFLN